MSNFNETDLYPILVQELDSRLPPELECRNKQQIVYNLHYTREEDTRTQAFQTDLAVFHDGHPRVIIEVKRNSATTHDLISYDEKAHRHKRVYPSLRYGMLLVETNGLTKRYLWHSSDIDFFYCSNREMANAGDFSEQELDELADMIERNFKTSQKIEQTLNDKKKPMSLHRDLQFD